MKIKAVENQKTVFTVLSENDIAYLTDPQFGGRFRIKRLHGTLGHEVIADNIVGAVRLSDGKYLYVQPKLPLPNLFRMLSFVGNLYKPLAGNVEYEKDEELFDIIGRIFAQELARILRRGLKQHYTQYEAALRSLRGRILFGESIKCSLIGSERLYCRYSSLSLDIPINRAWITAAEALLRSRAIATSTKKLIRACLSHISAGSIEPRFRLSDFNLISLDRGTRYYHHILFLSRLILQSCAYSNSAGEYAFSGFILDVANLFEQYVAKALHEHLPDDGFRAQSQKEVKLDREEQVNCIPDLTFLSSGKTAYIADTKYKNFSDLKFRNEDVFQILAYLIRHQCREGFLIYPSFDGTESGIVKTIHVPTEHGDITVHALCVLLDSPESVASQIQDVLNRKPAA